MNQSNYNYVKFCKIGESRGARPCAPTGVIDLWRVQHNDQRGLFLLTYLEVLFKLFVKLVDAST